jgi:hypothetical protein
MPRPKSVERQSISFRLNLECLERLRNAISGTGHETGLTLTQVVDQAMEKKALDLERRYNGGKPFSQRATLLPHTLSPRKTKE